MAIDGRRLYEFEDSISGMIWRRRTRHRQSQSVLHHQKSPSAERRLQRNLRHNQLNVCRRMTRRTSREDARADAPAPARYGNYSPCMRTLWKKRYLNAYFMEKTAPKIMFYGNLLYFMEILCHFMEICCDLWKFCVTGVSEAGRVFQAFRGWTGSVGVGRGRSGNRNVLRSDPRAGIG